MLVERLQHYFLTYKLVPGQRAQARITSVYGRSHAFKVVRAAMEDYETTLRVTQPSVRIEEPEQHLTDPHLVGGRIGANGTRKRRHREAEIGRAGLPVQGHFEAAIGSPLCRDPT